MIQSRSTYQSVIFEVLVFGTFCLILFFLALEQEGTVGPALRELVEAYLTDQGQFWHMRTFLQMAVRISMKTKGLLMEHQVAQTFYGLPLTNLAIHSAWIIPT